MRHFQATSGIEIGIRTQSTTYLPHQANVEQLFSRSGNLSDPNMDPMFLAALTSIGANKKAYKPTVAEIKEMYFQMYRGRAAENAEGGLEQGSSSTDPMEV